MTMLPVTQPGQSLLLILREHVYVADIWTVNHALFAPQEKVELLIEIRFGGDSFKMDATEQQGKG